MALIYVSDFLENLIDGHDVRNLVREQSREILKGVPEPAYSKLFDALDYWGGKCMGYPAVWLVQKAMHWNLPQTCSAVSCYPGSLYVSLTTSIMDDFLDRDQDVGPSDLMLAYMFFFTALRQPHWFAGDIAAVYFQSVYPLVASFVSDAPIRDKGDISSLYDRAAISGRRIGAFFETIACALVPRDAPQRDSIIELAGAFGEWCSMLDDLIDIELDLTQKSQVTVPLALLSAKSMRLAEAVARGDFDACKPTIASPSFINSLVEDNLQRVRSLRQRSQTLGFELLVEELIRVEARLPDMIRDVRSRVVASNRDMQARAPQSSTLEVAK